MRFSTCALVLCLAGCGLRPVPSPGSSADIVATFSIVAFDAGTGDLGVAVQSKVFGVGVVVPWVRADIGAVATQALANPDFGPDGLDLLDDGVPAEEVVRRLTAADEGRERRQVGVVDAQGRAGAFTGRRTLDWAGHVVGKGYCCQGNILAGPGVVKAMAAAYSRAPGDLADRLVAALEAGQAAGGDRRGRQSAALVVARRGGGYRGANDRYIDLRVDDHAMPITELKRLLAKRRASLGDTPVPLRMQGLRREPRAAVRGVEGPRALWERWKRLRAAGDWEAVLALATADYRRDHTLSELRAAEADPAAPQSLAERGHYLGTQVQQPKGRGLRRARLFFDVRGRAEPLMLVLVREDGRWCTVP